jgi:hypothetical protein
LQHAGSLGFLLQALLHSNEAARLVVQKSILHIYIHQTNLTAYIHMNILTHIPALDRTWAGSSILRAASMAYDSPTVPIRSLITNISYIHTYIQLTVILTCKWVDYRRTPWLLF